MRALVTGAAGGLGRSLAAKLSREGYVVTAVDRDAAGLASLEESVERVEPRIADLADGDGIPPMLDRICAGKRFDRVILCAGISATGRFEAIPEEVHMRVLDVNAVAPMLIASGLAQRDAFGSGACLVFISSLCVQTGYPGAASYAASKHAIAAYANSIRGPYSRMGIRVMTVFPGPIRTAHAERHAPANAEPSRRMHPDLLARRILSAARRGQATLFPDGKARLAAVAGTVFPDFVTAQMRRILFEKLEGERW